MRVSRVALSVKLGHLSIALVLGAALVGCADDAPVGIPVPCVGACVPRVDLSLSNVILTPGDTLRLGALARTAGGDPAPVQWSAAGAAGTVDSRGLVSAQSPGKFWVYARATPDPTYPGMSEIWVVAPDTGGQPFIAGFLDAATGALLPRALGFAGHDSIDVVLSYVVGHQTPIAGPPELVFEIRAPASDAVLAASRVPIQVRGRSALVRLRLHLTERRNGVRRFPAGGYDFFVLLPLTDNRRLGEGTGYRVSF